MKFGSSGHQQTETGLPWLTFLDLIIFKKHKDKFDFVSKSSAQVTLDLDLYLNYISALWSSLGWVHAHVHAQPLKTDTRQDCTQFSKESKNNGEDNKSQTGNENILELIKEYPNTQQRVVTWEKSFALFLSKHSTTEVQAAAADSNAGIKRNESQLQNGKTFEINK